jgi:acetyl-CoA C-acetyltransferase
MKSQLLKPIFLSHPTRSPIGKFGGSLLRFSAPDLAGLTLKEAVRRSNNSTVDFVIMGHARQAGTGPNPARQALFKAGLAESVPAQTINQACASGLTAIIGATEKILSGRAERIWAGGVESMSNTPYFLPTARWGQKMGNTEVLDGMHKDGFFCPMSDMVMGKTVETFLVPEFKISREEQDQFALNSQKKAALAWQKGLFKDEVFIVEPDGKKPGLNNDEHRRESTDLDSLKKLAPVFDAKSGTITAGNSSGIVDGSAFVMVSDQKSTHAVLEILDFETVALDPKRMGLGPVTATQNILKRNGLTVQDIAAFELNEAFAAQVIACQRTLKIADDKINIRGGSIALGHPIGASGCRIVVTLAHILKGQSGALGLATLCVSGGHGVAVLVKAL